jgi:hypothetical protein
MCGSVATSGLAAESTVWLHRPSSSSRAIFHQVAHALAELASGRSTRSQEIGTGKVRLMSDALNQLIPGSVSLTQTQPSTSAGRRPNVSWENPGDGHTDRRGGRWPRLRVDRTARGPTLRRESR